MAENNIGKLFARIATVSASLGALKRDSQHPMGYKYFSSDAVTGHLNNLLFENGLTIIPSVISYDVIVENDGAQRWLIRYLFTIGDVDGNVFSSEWIGEAPLKVAGKNATLYSDDKSLGKAHTYALKHWMMKLFMISTVDTDDLDANDPKPAAKTQAPKQAKQSTNPDDHFGKKEDGKPTVYTSKPITEIEVKQGEKGAKPYIVADGMTLFSRKPFRELDYDENLVEDLAKVGKHSLLENEAFRLAFYWEGKNKKPLRMIRVDSNRDVEIE